MINTTSELVFNFSGCELDAAIREALSRASKGILKTYKLEELNLIDVTTKTKVQATFPKFVELSILKKLSTRLDENYVRNAFEIYQVPYSKVTQIQFYSFSLSCIGSQFEYKPTVAKFLRQGIGTFLLALHSLSAITLPATFEWPKLRHVNSNQIAIGELVCSALLRFIDSYISHPEDEHDEAFDSIATSRKRKEWFSAYGPKLLLATGWHSASDVCLEDMSAIKLAELQPNAAFDVQHVYKALIDILERKFGATIKISVEKWGTTMRSPDFLQRSRRNTLHANQKFIDEPDSFSNRSDTDVLNDVLILSPSFFYPAELRNSKALIGLNLDLSELASVWLDLDEIYLKKVPRENYTPALQAIGHLNIYLFQYLPYWFHRNPLSNLIFPKLPNMLIPSVFVSRLIEVNTEVPITLIDLLQAVRNNREWVNATYYATLKQLEVLFRFLEQKSNVLPGCLGFKQPLTDYDFPKTPRNRGTNKRPIPSPLFSLFLDYAEALLAHLTMIQVHILAGVVSGEEVVAHFGTGGQIIDTFRTADLTGFIPLVFFKGRTIALRFIPNCLSLCWFKLKDGRVIKLPQPHALNQIIVALYTGLRHNHIQWLDAATFDCAVTEDDDEFTRLHVNTDKVKASPWQPHVNMRVVQVLRGQRAWRELIGESGFKELHFYNDNKATKWAKISPLFSSAINGLPHPDSRYSWVWQDILCAIQGLLPSIGEQRVAKLCSLEPPNVDFKDPAAIEKREAYGSSCKRVCGLGVKSNITSHSSRSTVISQYITFLPAEVIGRQFTGQKAGTVHYYVVLDEDHLERERAHQAMAIREHAYRNSTDGLARENGADRLAFIHADSVNSNLSRSLRQDLKETLISYGAISIVMNEDGTSGLDVLRETGGLNAAENKTEICPYGNHCPPEIVKQWRGPHRCGLCQYAVRCIDHLPAVAAKIKQFAETLDDLTDKLASVEESKLPTYSDAEFNRLDNERSRIAEELTGWRVSEKVLYVAKNRIEKGQDTRKWVVQKPEIILQDLSRVEAPSNLTAYTLLRLQECMAYPTMESAQANAQFDLMRRDLLARSGHLKEAFSNQIPINPAAECAGILRCIVEANNLTYDDLLSLLESDAHLTSLPLAPLQLVSPKTAYEEK